MLKFSEDSHIEMKMKENCTYLRKVRHVLFPEKYNGNNFIFLDGIHLEWTSNRMAGTRK